MVFRKGFKPDGTPAGVPARKPAPKPEPQPAAAEPAKKSGWTRKGQKLSPEAAAKAKANLIIGKGKPKGAKARRKDTVTEALIKAFHAHGGAEFFKGMTKEELKPLIAKMIERGEGIEEERTRHEQWLTYLEQPVD
jgi:hypothetical protein